MFYESFCMYRDLLHLNDRGEVGVEDVSKGTREVRSV